MLKSHYKNVFNFYNINNKSYIMQYNFYKHLFKIKCSNISHKLLYYIF